MLNLLSALLFVLLASTYSSASAQTPGQYTKGAWAATGCMNMGRGAIGSTNTATSDWYRPEAGLENNTASTAFVGCAVGTVRDSRHVYLDFLDANPNLPISCFLHVLTYNGVVKVQIGAKASIAYNSTPYRGYMEWFVPSTTQGYVVLTCQLPPNTSLLGWNTVTLPGE